MHYFKNTVLVLLLLLPMLSMGQGSLLLATGATMTEVQQNLLQLPQLEKERVEGEYIHYGNEFLTASYGFNPEQSLNRIRIVHRFESKGLARAEMEGYVTRYQKKGATVVPLFDDERVAIYYIYTETADIEVIFRKLGRKNFVLRVNQSSKDMGSAHVIDQNIALNPAQ